MRALTLSLLLTCTLPALASDVGDLQLYAEPGVQVHVDGRLRGTTSADEDGLYLRALPVGIREIKAIKPGFVAKTLRVMIERGKVAELRLGALRKHADVGPPGPPDPGPAPPDQTDATTGTLIVTSVPVRCEVIFRGTTYTKDKPRLLLPRVPPGTHFIAFRRSGQGTLMHKAKIVAGAETTLEADFKVRRVRNISSGDAAPDTPILRGAAPIFANRGGDRQDLIRRYGGSEATERAVRAGLEWLAGAQRDDGSWAARAKMGWVDLGVTGLAALAFLGAGHTPTQGDHRAVVDKALRYLIARQDDSGLIGGERGHYLYNHAIATLALVEAHGMTGGDLAQGPAQRAVAYLLEARNPGQAWRYGARDGDNDVSVTGWAVSALKAAKAAKLEIPGIDRALRESVRWIDSVTDDANWITGYKSRPPRGWSQPTSSRFQNDQMGVNTANTHAPNHTPTAIAIVCRAFGGVPRRESGIAKAARALAALPPTRRRRGAGSSIDYYYWFYGSQALFHAGTGWSKWNSALHRALLPAQKTSGPDAGSWDPIGAWGFAGGRTYTTAIGVLTLETYYRYPRLGK